MSDDQTKALQGIEKQLKALVNLKMWDLQNEYLESMSAEKKPLSPDIKSVRLDGYTQTLRQVAYKKD